MGPPFKLICLGAAVGAAHLGPPGGAADGAA